MYYVYILYCPVTELSYVGQTDHLIYRYCRHRDGKSHWTRRMLEPIVVHWEGVDTRGEAMKVEKYYKSGSGFRVRQQIIEDYLANCPPE